MELITCTDGRLRPAWADTSDLLRDYYDNEWNRPIHDEVGLFERLVLEGFQAGLSWSTILNRRPAFREAFMDFIPERVAELDPEPLMANAGIIRNRRKIEAAIHNAQATIALRRYTPLPELLWSFQPLEISDGPTSPESIAMSKELKSNGFKFVGPTTCFALMQAVGIIDYGLVH